MKYRTEVIIDLPRARVVELAMDSSLVHQWQKECVSRTLLEGEHAGVGSKTEVVSKMGRREIVMIETITANNLPEGFSETYETTGVWNGIDHRFVELGDSQTKWVMDNEFQCSGLMMKLMTWLMPGAFKKQSQKYADNFKAWAEAYQG